jgi:hypothetical protein
MAGFEKEARELIKIKILKCKLTVYYPGVFARMLGMDGLHNVHESFKIMDNIMKMSNMADGDGGKSGEFFFFTNDSRFVIKTVTQEEFKIVKGNIKRFYVYFSEHPESLISKPYGLFTFRGGEMPCTYRLMVMKNIVGCSLNQVQRVYDLKGSKFDREVVKSSDIQNKDRIKETLKDTDFERFEKSLKVSQVDALGLCRTLEADSSFLEKLQILDYSLLVVRVMWER